MKLGLISDLNFISVSFNNRVNEYLKSNISYLLVDPDENLVYTRRKLGCPAEHSSQVTGTNSPIERTKVSLPANGWSTSLEKAPMFTRAEVDEHIRNSGKRFFGSNTHYSLPNGVRKAMAFTQHEYLNEIEAACDQRYFYYRAKCFHSFKVNEDPHKLKVALCIISGRVKYAYCGPTCAVGKSGFCNHVLALMLKLCKYSLYACEDIRDLRHEEDENPSQVCTSTFQKWHQSRLDGIKSQPVMESLFRILQLTLEKARIMHCPACCMKPGNQRTKAAASWRTLGWCK